MSFGPSVPLKTQKVSVTSAEAVRVNLSLSGPSPTVVVLNAGANPVFVEPYFEVYGNDAKIDQSMPVLPGAAVALSVGRLAREAVALSIIGSGDSTVYVTPGSGAFAAAWFSPTGVA